MAQDRRRYEPEVVNEGLVIDVEPHEPKWDPDQLVLQVLCSGVVRELPGPVYEGFVGDAASSSLVDFQGESPSHRQNAMINIPEA